MKELFDSLWKVAPRLMSVISIFAFMFFICLMASRFYLKIENMDARLTRIEEKVDAIMEYLLTERAEREKAKGK